MSKVKINTILVTGILLLAACGKQNKNGGIQINPTPDNNNINQFRYVPKSAQNPLPVYLKSAFNYLRPAVAAPAPPSSAAPATAPTTDASSTTGATPPSGAALSKDKFVYMQINIFYSPKDKNHPQETYQVVYDEYVTCQDGERAGGLAGNSNISFHKVFDPKTITRKNNTVSLDGLGLISKVAGKSVAAYARVQLLSLINQTNYGTLSQNTFAAFYGKWNTDLTDYVAAKAYGDEPTVVKNLGNTCDKAPNTRTPEMPPLEWPANKLLPDDPQAQPSPPHRRNQSQDSTSPLLD